MWESISKILTSPNTWMVLLFLIMLVIVITLLAKSGLISVHTGAVKVGNDETERNIIRQQVEWTHIHLLGAENVLPHPEGYNVWKSRYILERIYDEVVDWITFNHLTTSSTYIEIKQDKIVSLVHSLVDKNDFKSEDFVAWMRKEIEDIIIKLVQIRELYK